MRKIKVVQIVGEKTMVGVARHVLLLSKELKKQGHDVSAIVTPGPVANQFKKSKTPCHCVKFKAFLNRRLYHEIRDIIASIKPDIVHCHGNQAGWQGRLAVRRLPEIAVVYSEYHFTKDFSIRNPVWREFHLRSMTLLNQFTDITIATSPSIKRYLISRGLSRRNRTVILPCPVELRFLKNKRYKKPEEVPQIIGAIGSLNPHNGYLWLLQALFLMRKIDKHSNWRCQIIGSGPLKKTIRKKIKKLKLTKHVEMFSSLPNPLSTMRHFTYYVQYSGSESTGIRLLEAMALGIVPICSDRGALADIVKNNKNGVLVPLGRPNELASALQALIKDKEKHNKLSANARATVTKHYSVRDIGKRLELIYSKALKIRHFKQDQGTR